MTNVADVRRDITAALNIDLINRNIVIEKRSNTYNEYGDEVTEFIEQFVVKGVVTDYVLIAPKYDPVGRYSASTSVVLLPYNVDIKDNKTRKDVIQYGQEQYNIIKIEEPRLGESDLFKRVYVQLDDTVDLTDC